MSNCSINSTISLVIVARGGLFHWLVVNDTPDGRLEL